MTQVDAKEFFEHTAGVLRAHVKPANVSALTCNLQQVMERRIGVNLIRGQVKCIDAMEMSPSKVPHSPRGGSQSEFLGSH